MEKGRSNTFNRALGHLKSTEIDEKLHMLSEIPTNNTSGIYFNEPQIVTDNTINGHLNNLDLDADDSAQNGQDTSGLFMPDGTILTIEPPGDTSYILGPMAAMYYTWSYPWTMIGYIRQSDRKMVNLARVDGKLSDWNGVDGFNSYGQLTLEQAVWFRDTPKQTGASNDPSTYNYYAFYPGPPSATPDANGRYPCIITGTPKRRDDKQITPEKPKSFNDDPHNHRHDLNKKKKKKNPRYDYDDFDDKPVPHDPLGDLLLLGLSAAAVFALKSAIAAGSAAALSRAKKLAQGAKNWWNKGRNQRIPNENQASWRDLMRDDLAQRGQSDAAFRAGKAPRGIGRPDQAFNPFRPASKGGPGSGPTPAVRQFFERPVRTIMNLFQGYEYEGEFIAEELGGDIIDALEDALKDTETVGEFMKVLDAVIAQIEKGKSKITKQTKEEVFPRKKIIKETKKPKKIIQEIKKPYVIKEIKQEKLQGYRPRVSGGLNTGLDRLMLKAENPASFKPMDETVWTKQDKYYNARLSQERKNEVLDHLGTSGHYWEILTETGRKSHENAFEEMYGDYKVVRKEQLIGDTLLLFADENGNKESMLQSEYQDMIARQFEEPLYEQEKLEAPKDPLVKRIKDKLSKQIDYPDKPAKKGYPNEPPPQMVNGRHPEHGKKSDYYNKLDPISANSMPATGDPEIDAKVNSQKRPLKLRKKTE